VVSLGDDGAGREGNSVSVCVCVCVRMCVYVVGTRGLGEEVGRVVVDSI